MRCGACHPACHPLQAERKRSLAFERSRLRVRCHGSDSLRAGDRVGSVTLQSRQCQTGVRVSRPIASNCSRIDSHGPPRRRRAQGRLPGTLACNRLTLNETSAVSEPVRCQNCISICAVPSLPDPDPSHTPQVEGCNKRPSRDKVGRNPRRSPWSQCLPVSCCATNDQCAQRSSRPLLVDRNSTRATACAGSTRGRTRSWSPASCSASASSAACSTPSPRLTRAAGASPAGDVAFAPQPCAPAASQYAHVVPCVSPSALPVTFTTANLKQNAVCTTVMPCNIYHASAPAGSSKPSSAHRTPAGHCNRALYSAEETLVLEAHRCHMVQELPGGFGAAHRTAAREAGRAGRQGRGRSGTRHPGRPSILAPPLCHDRRQRRRWQRRSQRTKLRRRAPELSIAADKALAKVTPPHLASCPQGRPLP